MASKPTSKSNSGKPLGWTNESASRERRLIEEDGDLPPDEATHHLPDLDPSAADYPSGFYAPAEALARSHSDLMRHVRQRLNIVAMDTKGTRLETREALAWLASRPDGIQMFLRSEYLELKDGKIQKARYGMLPKPKLSPDEAFAHRLVFGEVLERLVDLLPEAGRDGEVFAAFPPDVAKTLIDAHLEYLQVAYHETGSTVFVWRTFQVARRMNLPQPEWAMKVFDIFASNLVALTHNRSGRLATNIANALRFTDTGAGPNSAFTQAQKLREKFKVFAFLQVRRSSKGFETGALEAAQEAFKIGDRTLRRFYSEIDELLKASSASEPLT